jgi:hypothetical protein
MAKQEKQIKQFKHSTIIKDPLLLPYFIGKDNNCYTIYEEVKPDEDSIRSIKGDSYIKTHTFHSTFTSCLKSITNLKMNEHKEFNSIKEYISEYEKLIDKLKQITINIE